MTFVREMQHLMIIMSIMSMKSITILTMKPTMMDSSIPMIIRVSRLEMTVLNVMRLDIYQKLYMQV